MDRARRRAFGARIARLRKQAKLTQEQLAERSGLAPSSIARIEIGSRLLSLNKLYDLAAGLGVSAALLVADDRAVAAEGTELWGRRGLALAAVTLELADRDVDLLLGVATRLRDGGSRRR